MRRATCGVGENANDGVEAGIETLNRGEREFNQFGGGDVAPSDKFGEPRASY